MRDSSETDMRLLRRFSAGILFAVLAVSAGLGPARADRTVSAPPKSGSVSAPVDLEQKIGQMILVGFLGNNPGHPGFQRVRQQLQAGKIGGALYLGRNLESRDTVRRMNAALTSVAPDDRPPLIAIDQEGGAVQRLKRHHGFPQTVSAKRMAGSRSPAEAATAYGVLAGALADWGFTLNLGPVVDVDINPRNPIIGRLERSYSSDPARVVDYAAAFVDAHRQQDVLTALKHFPGHGSSRRDSHMGVVDVSRTWSEKELEPFRKLIETDTVDLIMTAHVINRSLRTGGERIPISLSHQALTEVLRGDLGYSGVIISDDLQMDAIRRNFSLEEAVVRTVAAGTDILLFANDKRPDPEIPEKVAAILRKAVETNPGLEEKIDAAYGRILALKGRLSFVQ
ncbi:MAG: glycoside hydrolase family 3 protein [Roseibium sp.]